MSKQPVFPRSNVLILGPNSIQSLVPSTLISQAESLLESHRLDDAYSLVDKRRKKLEESITVNEDEAEELRYVYQRIGFQCFKETLFEDAGKHLFNGEVDPRLLISYYPDLRGSLFTNEEALDVFAGIAEHMPMEGSVDDIIVSNLVMNYSPHLEPNTLSAPPTAELRKILGMAAKDMLLQFLRKTRTRRSVTRGRDIVFANNSIDIAIDTVLVKLYAEFEKTSDLYSHLANPHAISLPEVEHVLKKTGQYNALCVLYKQRGEDLKLLDVLSKLVEGKWTDEDMKDPLSQMIALLNEKRDKALTQQWGLWLTKLNPEKGLKLLMPKDNGKRRERPEDDLALLQQIEDTNASAGVQYLEYLVFTRRSTSREIHMKLALTCIDQIIAYLQDSSVSKLWKAKASSYAASRHDSTFLSYFASTTPDSEHKRARVKTILFLAGSSLYDPQIIRDRLLGQEKILGLELAIIEGKLGEHQKALRTLLNNLGDSTSAETYCALGGVFIPTKTAQKLAVDAGLQHLAIALYGLSTTQKGTNGKAMTSPAISRTNTVNEQLKKDLVKILLEVYMSVQLPERASHLLSTQAMNLDVLDVISAVPENWPVNMMTSFLSRSFRRTLHAQQEGKIVKNISAGQNLQVKDVTWDPIREAGAMIEEAADENDEKVINEKDAANIAATQSNLSHVIGLERTKETPQGPNVTDIDVEGIR